MTSMKESFLTPLGVIPPSASGASAYDHIEGKEYKARTEHMRSRHLLSRRPSPQCEAAWTITIDTDNLGALFRARYFLAGILIGAVILLPVFLVMG